MDYIPEIKSKGDGFMPNVDVTCLETDSKSGWLEDSEELAQKLTDVFVQHAGCKPAAVHVRFHPVREDHYIIGGKTVRDIDTKTARIFQIDVAWYAGRTPETQDVVAAWLTEVVQIYAGFKRKNIEVNFSLLEPANHYEGGKRAPAPSR
jgi:phenylpyruvate tautomerase PptA (4-oxalocrotonate tautomerase family)